MRGRSCVEAQRARGRGPPDPQAQHRQPRAVRLRGARGDPRRHGPPPARVAGLQRLARASTRRAPRSRSTTSRTGCATSTVDDVFIGNGVSELISMVLQAFVDDGNEILVPGAGLPAVDRRGHAVRRHPRALPVRRGERLEPRPRGHRVQDHREHPRAWSSSTPTTPPAPSTARRSSRAWSTSPAGTSSSSSPTRSTRRSSSTTPSTTTRRRAAGDDVLCLTFSGLSKAYRVCGYRAGWVMISGPKELADGLPRGPHPDRQHADVRQRARPARDPDRARRLPVDRGADRPRRPVLRAEHARPPAAQRDPRRHARSSRGARSTASRGWTPRSTPIDDDEAVRHRPAARQEDPGHPRHRLQLAATPTTSGW